LTQWQAYDNFSFHMKYPYICLFFPFLILSTFCSCTEKPSIVRENIHADLFNKKDVTIVVTDSGLGGLSILADAAERMKTAGVFRKAGFIFFNALFSNESGYNALKTREEKINVFNSALKSIESNYNPDLILIGCNTLSVLYKDTPFARAAKIPVVGIVDAGVEIMADHLKDKPESRVILFATQTTVREGTHKNKLVEKGFLEERIIAQACPDLGQFIEKGYDSDETEMLIFAYVDEALQKVLNHRSSLLVSFNCTHYGYSLDSWEKAFKNLGIEPLAFINPNSKMNDFLFAENRKNRYKKTTITVSAVSMVEIGKKKIESIGKWLKQSSPQTAAALADYELKGNLFEWKKYVKE
jgi:glutamate racemase